MAEQASLKLPPRRARSRMAVMLRTLTPIYGGGSETRLVDRNEPVRAAAVRGHLRFWWRALYAPRFQSLEDLRSAERNLWGWAGRSGSVRSAVDVEVSVDLPKTAKAVATVESRPSSENYALWPGRETKDAKVKLEAAQILVPGLEFELRLSLSTDANADEVAAAMKAWVAFGGYGGRTRRGCGSLTISCGLEPMAGLVTISDDALVAPFAIAASAAGMPSKFPDLPALAGSTYWLGRQTTHAEDAWREALGWLRDFRQKPGPTAGSARESGRNMRPGRSRWPEGDKLRLLGKAGHDSHDIRFKGVDPVWPRASFGLPIPVRFQTGAKATIKWRRQNGREPRVYDRLASPLIVKPIALANGRFAPLALWLRRSFPAGGEAYVDGAPASGAPFDVLFAAGDLPRDVDKAVAFAPLVEAHHAATPGGGRVQHAFRLWMRDRGMRMQEFR
jgi:CRISPR-associated protein Cmr1